MAADLKTWALPRLQRLLPLDNESLDEILTYTLTLSREGTAEHLKNMLGDTSSSLEFISSFNSRRPNPPAQQAVPSVQTIPSDSPASISSTSEAPPRSRQRQAKKKANIHALPARQIQDRGDVGGAYQKRDEDDYMASSRRPKEAPLANVLALSDRPEQVQRSRPTQSADPLVNPAATASAIPTDARPSHGSRAIPPSASGPLISDALAPKTKSNSTASPRHASPAPKTKIAIQGGTAMHGASSTISDLDSAIRSLEIQTNPSLSSATTSSQTDTQSRKCTCMATRHPLLAIAPNCMSCGKIICVKEGLGPCTYCGSALLGRDELDSMLRVLKEERGKERQIAHNAGFKRAEVAAKPRPFSGRDFLSTASASNPASRSGSPFSSNPASDTEDSGLNVSLSTVGKGKAEGGAGLSKAEEHRDRLLGFQTQNARRTRIHDEAADFDVPSSGTNMWASPQQRAMQLKQQQKVMREMEWNARPEYEKRRVVASIDLAGRKVVRRMAAVERPESEAEEHQDQEEEDHDYDDADRAEERVDRGNGKRGAFSRNPLMGALVRPVARQDKDKGKEAAPTKTTDDGQQESRTRSTWRRVQDDNDDNEHWILDGGAYGGRNVDVPLGEEEHAFG